MAQIPPIIQGDLLVYQQDGHTFQAAMGTPAWYTWVKTASRFTFRSAYGTFTAHKERAGNRRGGSTGGLTTGVMASCAVSTWASQKS